MTVTKIGSLKLRQTQQLLKIIRKTLPVQLGNLAKNHFTRSFDQGGFTDTKLSRWQPRRKRLGKGKFSATQTERANLTKEGTLKRSVKILRVSFPKTIIGSRLPYSAIHNEGLPGKVFGKVPFIMPKRQYLGNSKVLEKNMGMKIIKEINKAFFK